MAEIANKLMKMKTQIEKAKLEKARFEGQLSNLYKQLKTNFSCSDLTQAQRKQEKMGKDIDRMETQLEKAVKRLENEYRWSEA